jgi:hypothetical protein
VFCIHGAEQVSENRFTDTALDSLALQKREGAVAAQIPVDSAVARVGCHFNVVSHLGKQRADEGLEVPRVHAEDELGHACLSAPLVVCVLPLDLRLAREAMTQFLRSRDAQTTELSLPLRTSNAVVTRSGLLPCNR